MGQVEDAYRDCIRALCKTVLGTRKARSGALVPSMADSARDFSVAIGEEILADLRSQRFRPTKTAVTDANQIGAALGPAIEQFLEDTLNHANGMQRIRPVTWKFQPGGKISTTAQYRHLDVLQRLHESPDRLAVAPKKSGAKAAAEAAEERTETLVALSGEYIVKPDLLVLRPPITDAELNPARRPPAFTLPTGELADLRRVYGTGRSAKTYPLCHANISLKWTIRSDRVQNIRTEALQMIRQRRGPMPRIVAVTAEPLPSRLESVARGTGELDAVYHVALHPLIKGLENLAVGGSHQAAAEKALPVIYALRDAGRLKDLTDLPFDLAS
jgi:NgoMIV restriction enzyme